MIFRRLVHAEVAGADNSKEPGHWIGRALVGPEELRGQGIGTAMVRAVLEIGFAQLALHRVDLYVFDFNRRAIACYEKVGFRTEGLLRDARRVGEKYWSLVGMSILEAEWRATSGAIH